MPPLRALQALCWLTFLGLVVSGGHASTYVVAWQSWLVLGALIVLAAGVVIGLVAGSAHLHDGHKHEQPSWIETGVHALPLMLFLAVGPTTLGSHTLSSSFQIDATRHAPLVSLTPTISNGYTHTDLLALRHDPFLEQRQVEVIARLGVLTEQTTRRQRSGPAPIPRPVLFRHVISCCAADGQPIYAWLKEPPPADLPVDAWVNVRGTVNARATGGVIPVITADRITVLPTPSQPYLILPGFATAAGHVAPTIAPAQQEQH